MYLHNAAESQMDGPGDQAFLKKLKEAFVWLEKARKEGKIAAYGMVSYFPSSNTPTTSLR